MTTDSTAAIKGGYDPRAVSAAKFLRDAIDAECVILFGSRCRSDWNEQSDVDLMIINPELPDSAAITHVTDTSRRIVADAYPAELGVDLVFMSSEDYQRLSRHTINSVARMARREGIKMPRNSEAYSNDEDDGRGGDHSEEHTERERRIADANMHYLDMHTLLDAGTENKNIVYNAHQTLEHGMKALISALGREYPHHHELTLMADPVKHNDAQTDWHFQSDLGQLDLFAGRDRYGPLLRPITDYAQMANVVTEDLLRIHQRIADITGTDPWEVPPEGTTQIVKPRYR